MEEQIYDYLINNCVGYNNRIKAYKLMRMFNINNHKTFRSKIQKIRQNKQFKKIVGSEAGKRGGYWIIANENEYKETMFHLRARSDEMKKTCDIIDDKWNESQNEVNL